MKWLIVATCAVALVMPGAGTQAAGASDTSFAPLVARVMKASAKPDQAKYSTQLRKSVNSTAVRRVEQACAKQHPGKAGQTFSMMGVMRIDGVFRKPTPLPDNDFTRCVSDNMDSVNFPLPPGDQTGWPVVMQFDATTGKVIFVMGDRQTAVPHYRQPRSAKWVYTPTPLIPKSLKQQCVTSVWVSVQAAGYVNEVDLDDSNCPKAVRNSVMNAAHQWIYTGATDDSMDLRVSFRIVSGRVRVAL